MSGSRRPAADRPESDPRAGAGRRRTMPAVGLRVVAAGLALAAAVALGLGLTRDRASSDVLFAGDLRQGGRLEELRLPRLEGEGVVEYASYSARPLVINFFASWCPTCVAEMPDLERVHRQLGGEVTFLGVSQSDARSASIELARATGITYDTAIDPEGRFFRALGGLGMPTTVFVGPGGEIVEIWVGALDAVTLRGLIAEHFGVGA